ncbi:MAG TPA: iron chelate uptake ABC transporter family permease subunit [Pyrinomonadaceae bacterium]|nr:iron chelate uptake ABC transporter family permease subunit [Pyrinomonadaceae bacterium]
MKKTGRSFIESAVVNNRAEENKIRNKSKANFSLRRKSLVYFGGVAFLLVLFLVLGIGAGSISIEPEIVVRVLAAKILPNGWVETARVSEAQQVIVWLVRTPRVIVAALVGAALALAGAQMQGLFKNPLASPDIIGTSAGGALGAVLAFAAGLAARSLFYLPVFAFVGSFLAVFTVYFIATRRGRTPIATLLLAGVALGSLVGAAISFVITSTSVRFEVAQEILFWLLGGLENRTWAHVWIALPCVIVGIIISIFYTRELDLLLAGEEIALSLGVEVEQTKRILLTVTALLTGAAVAVSGVVGFVGLIVPHIVRQFLGPRHRTLLPASALTGAAFLVGADLLARTLLRPEEIRLGIVTAAFGAPFFLYLLLRHRREVDY